jgi:RNA polymerase sigma factor (TIGR02999 family)
MFRSDDEVPLMEEHTETASDGSSPGRDPDSGANGATNDEHSARSQRSVTVLLRAWAGGERAAADRLFGRVYGELRRLARAQHRRWSGEASLDSSALVHDAYLKLVGGGARDLRDRGHFFALAARAMRQILSNDARRRRAGKRGEDIVPISLDRIAGGQGSASPSGSSQAEQLATLDEALERLEAVSPRPCRVVECRFYGGLSVAETAAALGISEATVKRDWATAQAWLYRELHEDRDGR